MPTVDSRGAGSGASSRKSKLRLVSLEEIAQKGLDAEFGQRAAEEHRRELAGEHRTLVERVTGRVEQTDVLHEARMRLLAEQLAQAVILERARVNLGAMSAVIFGSLEQMHLLEPAVVDPDERAVAMDRPRHRMASDLEVRLDVAHQLERILAHAIALVDEGEDRRPAPFANVEQLPGPVLDAPAVVEQHHRAVGGDERAVGVLGEVLVARRVEEVDVVPLVLELHHARGDRDAALLLELHPVRRRMPRGTPRLDRPGQMDGSAVEEELFRQGRLAGVRMADDREGATGAYRLLQSTIELERQRNYLP